MEHQCSEPDVSAHNGEIEQFNRTIEEKARAVLLESGFPSNFCGLALGQRNLYTIEPHIRCYNSKLRLRDGQGRIQISNIFQFLEL